MADANCRPLPCEVKTAPSRHFRGRVIKGRRGLRIRCPEVPADLVAMNHGDPITEDRGKFSRHFRAIAPRHSATIGDNSSLVTVRAQFGGDGPDRLGSSYGRPGGFTDDTQMTLFTAEGLLRADTRMRERGVCDETGVVLHAYLRWLHTQHEPVPPVHGFDPASFLDGWLVHEPEMQGRRAPGNSCLAALRSGAIGTVDAPINNSKGCGAVMRMAPVGLLADDPRTAFQRGVALGALTHGHPSGYLPAGAFAATICSLVLGDTMRNAFAVALSILREWSGHDETTSMLGDATSRAGDGPPDPRELERYGEGGWWGSDALAIAARVALACDDPKEAIRRAVNHTGDSDSTGSLVGNLIGARLGEEALPTEWVERLEGAPIITTIADDLLTARSGEAPSTWAYEERSPGHYVSANTGDPRADQWFARYPGW